MAIGVVSTLATQAGSARSITTRDLPGPNRPKRNPLTTPGARPRPSDRRIELEVDFGHVDDDAVGIDQRPRLGGDRPERSKSSFARLAVVGQPRRDGDRRRVVSQSAGASAASAGREPRGRPQQKGRQQLAQRA